ncbi:hypothetical protein ACHAPU_010893 [Fusarium lateritium]
MDTGSALPDLIEAISRLMNQAKSCERISLYESLQLLRTCLGVRPFQHVSDLLEQEIKSQVNWTEMYRNYQHGLDTVCFGPGSKVEFDREFRLCEFAKEVLQGAKTICTILDQSPEVAEADGRWVLVTRMATRTGSGNHDADRPGNANADWECVDEVGCPSEDSSKCRQDEQDQGGEGMSLGAVDPAHGPTHYWYF